MQPNDMRESEKPLKKRDKKDLTNQFSMIIISPTRAMVVGRTRRPTIPKS